MVIRRAEEAKQHGQKSPKESSFLDDHLVLALVGKTHINSRDKSVTTVLDHFMFQLVTPNNIFPPPGFWMRSAVAVFQVRMEALRQEVPDRDADFYARKIRPSARRRWLRGPRERSSVEK